ncbi:hypothetical protein TRICI_000907 [Trichomonascus ciferrii]|uniref:RING-type E3 ubiquitin transferase n=1 Tax=Trichomonascus ciferrii TaxID=44093 RepID=A0A642V9X7_9ASCO|nr:hypothetical protein TRICI_000907 [Trichomonascus ciferrii]
MLNNSNNSSGSSTPTGEERKTLSPSPAPSSTAKAEETKTSKEDEAVEEKEKASKSAKVESEKASQSPKPQTPTPAIPFADWQDGAISAVFKVSLKNPKERFLVLESLNQEFESEGIEKFSTELLDRILWARLTEYPCLPSPFEYLWNSWLRAGDAKRLLRQKDPEFSHKVATYNELQSFSVRYMVLVATTDMVEGVDATKIAERIIIKANASPPPWEFLLAAVERAASDEMIIEFLSPLVHTWSRECAKTGYQGDYKPYMLALETLLTSKSVASVFTQLDGFAISEQDLPYTIPVTTLLGPFLALSPINFASRKANFPNPDFLPARETHRLYGDIRSEYRVVQNRLFEICNKIVRGSVTSRKDLLKYFGKIIDLNHKRMAIQVQQEQVSPDGFMLNITYIMTKLSEPFTDLYGSKIDKIDIDYFLKDPVFDISEETKVKADIEDTKLYLEKKQDGVESNFITHTFFLTAAYHQYGFQGAINSQKVTKRKLRDLEARLQQAEAEISRFRGSGRESSFNRLLETMKNDIVETKRLRLALECVLLDHDLQSTIMSFALFQTVFLIRAAKPDHDYPKTGGQLLSLPFEQDNEPESFANYPEYMLECPVNFVNYLMKTDAEVVVSSPFKFMLIFAVVFLRNSQYIKNPYLKVHIVEMLFLGAMEVNGQRGLFVDVFDTEPVCLDYLFHSLMSIYIEIEKTGASSQFYDKFTARFYISHIMRCLWNNSAYQQKLRSESENDVDFFVQFVALLLNDATYLFDESLTKLTEIHKLQKELPEPPHFGDPQEDAETQEKRQQLATAERHAESYMQLTNQSVILLKLFTSAVPSAFVTPEIVDRLAAMMNYNLKMLVGPKCRELKVRNPEKYKFNPRELLSLLLDSYLNLRKEPSFIKAVARDGRSYDPDQFDKARKIVEAKAIKSVSDLDLLEKFKQDTIQIKNEDEEGELELGDIPDEFLDPLMFTLMEEPVTLPSSRVTIDLGTIKSHLLSDPKDPFNREPLKVEDVIPNTELKQRIEDFKKQKKAEYQANKMDQSAD